jgi:methionyl-tRNA formyltransferase
MKVVVLTSRLHSPGLLFLCNALKSSKINVEEVVCARNPIHTKSHHIAANHLLLRQARAQIMHLTHQESWDDTLQKVKASGIHVSFFTEPFHDPKVVEYLSGIAPDILVQINGPIFRKSTISTARLGLINCHMGLLPEFRGMNVAEWSVLHGYPTGNTIHFIDRGIDTGNILQFFETSVVDCSTIQEMRNKLASLQYQQIAKVIKMIQEKAIVSIPQVLKQGKQYFRMHPDLKTKVEQTLAQGYQPKISVEERCYVTKQ